MTGHWREFAGLAGLSVDDLPGVVPPYADPAGVAVLRKVNRQLGEPVGRATVDLLVRSDPERTALPVAPTSSLLPLVERWQTTLAHAGYDVRGDLAMLTEETRGAGPARAARPAGRRRRRPGRRARCERRLRTRVAELEDERERLDRKRRKWKHRAQAARG